ncbi:hypothetical protein N1F78_06980 [Seonamhaeicola sp. MEBiC1930]|uniref:hypothetical protein n=1 Tax=Seonamhaeicola sp. MEBiC01930 TaxID=2976768 RepID=UPI003253A532
MIKPDLIIREPNKPLINRVLVSLIYATFFTYIVYLFQYKEILRHPEKSNILVFLIVLLLIIFLSTFMVIASHSIHISTIDKKIQHQYRVGVFRYREVWQDLNDLEYISVFRRDDNYLVNLWYEDNGILNLMVLKDDKQSIEKGLFIAEKLNIDLLDAREKGNHRWIDKKATKETGEIIYIS